MTLRLAYNTNGAANHRLDDAIALIADHGYDGVALTLDHHHLDPLAPDWIANTKLLATRLRQLGLGNVIETGARYLLNPRDKHEPTFVTADAQGRNIRLEFIKRAIDIAAILDSETVSFWSGVPKAGVAVPDARAWLDEGLAKVCDHAISRGISVSLEPEPGMLIETVGDYDAMRGAHPTLRLALDVGHCLVTQDCEPADAVMAYAPLLGTVSIEDMKRGVHIHLPFGQGDMDTGAVLAALRAISFNKLVCVELSRESPRAHEAIPEAIAYLKAVAIP